MKITFRDWNAKWRYKDKLTAWSLKWLSREISIQLYIFHHVYDDDNLEEGYQSRDKTSQEVTALEYCQLWTLSK